MAKPRKASGDARVRAGAGEPTIPPASCLDWTELEACFDAKIDTATRERIWEAAVSFLSAKALNEAAQDRAKQVGRKSKEHTVLTKLEQALFKCTALWREADADGDASLVLIDLEAKMRQIDFDALRLDLETTAYGLKRMLHNISEDLREPEKPFNSFVVAVAKILKSTGHKVSYHGRGYDENNSDPTPFQKLVLQLNRCLNEPEPLHSEPAFTARIAKALRGHE